MQDEAKNGAPPKGLMDRAKAMLGISQAEPQVSQAEAGPMSVGAQLAPQLQGSSSEQRSEPSAASEVRAFALYLAARKTEMPPIRMWIGHAPSAMNDLAQTFLRARGVMGKKECLPAVTEADREALKGLPDMA